MCLKWEERSCLFGTGNLEFSALFSLLPFSCWMNLSAGFISLICKVEITKLLQTKMGICVFPLSLSWTCLYQLELLPFQDSKSFQC